MLILLLLCGSATAFRSAAVVRRGHRGGGLTQLNVKKMVSKAKAVRAITGDESFLEAMQMSSDDTIVAVKFYASWCRACKTIAPKYGPARIGLVARRAPPSARVTPS